MIEDIMMIFFLSFLFIIALLYIRFYAFCFFFGVFFVFVFGLLMKWAYAAHVNFCRQLLLVPL